jgi:hypothetical protein
MVPLSGTKGRRHAAPIFVKTCVRGETACVRIPIELRGNDIIIGKVVGRLEVKVKSIQRPEAKLLYRIRQRQVQRRLQEKQDICLPVSKMMNPPRPHPSASRPINKKKIGFAKAKETSPLRTWNSPGQDSH